MRPVFWREYNERKTGMEVNLPTVKARKTFNRTHILFADHTRGPYRFLSQFFDSPFKDDSGTTFKTAEQCVYEPIKTFGSLADFTSYMHYRKAVLFGDREMIANILRAETPHDAKKLGRQVAGFDAIVWEANREQIVFQGNLFKFTNSATLMDGIRLGELLLATDGKKLVECAPWDSV